MGQAKKKQLECPAVGRRIKPDECGENRISSYDCPVDCPHNPWSPGNYGRSLEIQDRFHEKILARLKAEQVRERGYTLSPPVDDRWPEFSTLQWFSNKFYRETDAQGRSFKQRWEAERLEGLNNDQRLLLEAESKMRVVVLEIRQVIDDQGMLAVDLLNPDPVPFRVLDWSLAGNACRFTTLFAVVFDLPHYSRIHSVGYPLPDVSGMGAREVFMEVATHLAAPARLPALRDWLAHNLCKVVSSLFAITAARREAMLRSMDMTYTKSVYDLKCPPEKLRKLLGKQKDIEPEEVPDSEADDGFVAEWVCLGGKSREGDGETLVGRILLHADGWLQLEASSAARSEQLKQRVETVLDKHIDFSRERSDDLALQHLGRTPYDASLVPEQLLRNSERIETTVSRIKLNPGISTKAEIEKQMEVKFMKTFLENPVPLLDGLTPRQAARDASMRPRLLELMKSHIRKQDENNLRTGHYTDINWMLEELGLDEINFPPPPPRARPANEEGCEDDEDDEYKEPSLFMLDEESIEEGNARLDKDYPGKARAELFARLHPQACEDLSELCQTESEDVLDLVMDLAARVVFIQHIAEKPADRDRFVEDIDNAQDWIIDLLERGEHPADELMQPLLSKYVYDELDNCLRFGNADPLFAKLYIYLSALAEVVDSNLMEHLLKLARDTRR